MRVAADSIEHYVVPAFEGCMTVSESGLATGPSMETHELF